MMLLFKTGKFVVNEVQDYRASRAAGKGGAQGSAPGAEPGGPSGDAAASGAGADGLREETASPTGARRSIYTAKPAGQGAGEQGGAGMAFDLDLPSDPEAARTKRWSFWALVTVGAGLVVDVSSVLMSIQPLFYLVGGSQHLYGLTYGAYDLLAFLTVPLYGLWVDRTNAFKRALTLGIVLNVIGNFVYAFTVLAGRWWMMLLGRGLAGLGGATLGVGSAYITRTSRLATRQAKLGRYRIMQNVARTAGPIIGFLFLGLPSPTNSASTAIKVFNWYTLPGWISGFVVILLGIFFVLAFTDPTRENQHFIKEHDFDATERGDEARGAGKGADDGGSVHSGKAAVAGHQEPAAPAPVAVPDGGKMAPSALTGSARAARFHGLVVSWMILSFLVCLVAFGSMSNLFALFAGQYHGVWQQSDTWRVFIGAGAGSIAGAMLYRRLLRIAPNLANERYLIMVSNWLLFVAFFLVIPFKGPDWVPPSGLFYASTAITGFANVINLTTMESFFSKKLTQYNGVVGSAVGRYMSAIFMAMSLGRFAGPLIVGAVTRIATPAGDVFYCPTGWIVEPEGDVFCGAPPDTICGITASDYYVGGCVLYNAVPMYIALAATQFVSNLWMHFVIHRNWSYDD